MSRKRKEKLDFKFPKVGEIWKYNWMGGTHLNGAYVLILDAGDDLLWTAHNTICKVLLLGWKGNTSRNNFQRKYYPKVDKVISTWLDFVQ